jgi:hypothetical protein
VAAFPSASLTVTTACTEAGFPARSAAVTARRPIAPVSETVQRVAPFAPGAREIDTPLYLASPRWK